VGGPFGTGPSDTTREREWFAYMRRGDFAAAWAVSDAILREHQGRTCYDRPRHEQWVWDGTPLEGKRVLIRCYHGLGDTIMFARYFPLVKRIASDVVAWVQPSLIPLLSTMRDPVKLLPLHDGTAEVEYDVDIESMELMHALRVVPDDVPYLHVEPLERMRAIGLVTRAGDWDPRRSIEGDVRLPRTVSLPNDPLTTARFMRALDLVVTVDTMTAHLAGALGVPVWVLLPYECDWRWQDEREDSPWYPTMRLFRQRRPGDWADVLDRVRYAIAMGDEEKKDSTLNEWGIDVDKFRERAKESLGQAKDDLSEIAGTLRQTLVQAKDVVLGLPHGGSGAAAEIRGGFERAWREIEQAFKAARDKAKDARSANAPNADANEPPTTPPEPPPV